LQTDVKSLSIEARSRTAANLAHFISKRPVYFMKTPWLALLAVVALARCLAATAAESQPQLGLRSAPTLQVDHLRFKDLNKNGKLDPYEDWRRPVEERVSDLIAQMTLEEKAGMMVGPTLPMGPDGTVSEESSGRRNPFAADAPPMASPGTTEAIQKLHITQFINRVNTDAGTMATWLNRVQEIAEKSRLGIPVIFVTNPRNHVSSEVRLGINEATGNFSQWPGTLGLAATRDAALVEEFARIAAQEYVSVGIRGAYHPQIDVATEPRWPRISGTFGEDANLCAELAVALVRGFQGSSLGPRSVALTFKHFPGGGPAGKGLDSHYASGKNQAYPGKNFDYHLIPFKAAISAGAVSIMPYYAIPTGQTSEEVGMAFNREIITDLLRGKLGFKGMVNSDSGITTGMPWGVESLSVRDRYKKAIEAGTDLIGNDATPGFVVELVKANLLTEARIDESVRRILRVRFALGTFENPYADPEIAKATVGKAEFRRKADLAQRKSIVLLKNSDRLLPLANGRKVYAQNVDATALKERGYVVVATPEEADACVIRVIVSQGGGGRGGRAGRRGGAASAEPAAKTGDASATAGRRGGRGFGPVGGSDGAPVQLTLPAEVLERARATMSRKPTIVAIELDRPYVIPELARESAALLATFGVTDAALVDVISGRFNPGGKLPFELPSSMAAVERQAEDVPFDSPSPLFRYGTGLTYAK